MLRVDKLDITIAGKTILEDVSFAVGQGQTLCIAGESGSGKSSLLKAVNGLMPVRFERLSFRPHNQNEVVHEGKWQGKPGLPGSRWVMQDPIAALNPKRTLGASVGESLHLQKPSTADLSKAISTALADVELPAGLAARKPSEVSLGQAQRACLARALIARPSLIFFDEPLSALDAIVQKQIAATMTVAFCLPSPGCRAIGTSLLPVWQGKRPRMGRRRSSSYRPLLRKEPEPPCVCAIRTGSAFSA